MSNGVININSKKLELLSNFLENSSRKIDYNVQNSCDNFTKLKQANLFRDGIRKVEKAYLEIQGTLQNNLKILNEFYDSLYNVEKKYIKVIEEIKIPNAFNINDVISDINYNNVKISKNDGLSVNSGSYSGDINTLSNDTTINHTNLFNIDKNSDISVNNIDSNSSIIKENIYKMNDNDIKIQELDSTSNIYKENLQDINKNNTSIQMVDSNLDNINIKKVNLEDNIKENE